MLDKIKKFLLKFCFLIALIFNCNKCDAAKTPI